MVAVAALPVHEPDEPDVLPVTLPVKLPITVSKYPFANRTELLPILILLSEIGVIFLCGLI